ncbi:MAG: DNA recombination protein RmuC [Flectobacillus sp.]|nr:DNA recombination protein RmuC [Flectobacillus sp.]
MEYSIYLLLGVLFGGFIGYMYAKTQLENNFRISENRLDITKEELIKAQVDLTSERRKVVELTGQLAAAEANFQNIEDKLHHQKDDFKALASEILEQKSRALTLESQEGLEQILSPFREKIKDFEQQVSKSFDQEIREKVSLVTEVRKLYELNARISQEAHNLTNALKGDNKTQGNWGELILEKVLERSGLVKDIEYKTQVTSTNLVGQSIKPDVVIYLPEKKHLIIDAKVSLVAYEQYVSETDPLQIERFRNLHLNSVRNHIRLLSEKNYQSAFHLNVPEFVLLFMPIESAFSLAIQSDVELFNFAWDRRVILVSPTTLLATLRTVASVWKMEKQSRNVLEIARLSGDMYDKFEGFANDLLKIGQQLNSTKDTYHAAVNKLTEGRGNLVRTAEKIKSLGAKTTKTLPQSWVDKAGEE